MNKNLRKIIVTVSAMVMCALPMTSVESNAYWLMKNQEQYQEKIDSLNSVSSFESRPDLCERFTKLIHWYSDSMEERPEKSVENVWIQQNDVFNLKYTIDTLHYDSLHVYLTLETEDLTPEIIKQEISQITDVSNGIKDFEVKYNSETNPTLISVLINFSGDNHNENYTRCTDIVAGLKKYNVKSSFARIAWHAIENRIKYLNSINFGILTDDEVNTINEDFKNQEFNVHLGKREDLQKGDLKDNYYVIFENPEEWTLEDALDVAVYCEETYDKYATSYVEASSGINNSSIDLLNLAGDANEDGEVTISDAVIVMQSVTNPDGYKLSAQGEKNADIDGDGLTTIDALTIQEMLSTSNNMDISQNSL